MEKRKIRDEADARSCIEAAAKSGVGSAAWARAAGVDGRSLRAWTLNLGRGAASRTRGRGEAPKRMELVELVPVHKTLSRARYIVRVGAHGIEVDDRFDAATLRRLVVALSAC